VDQHRKIITTQIIEDVVNKSLSDTIQIRDLMNAMQSSGFGLAMAFFAFTALVPLPPPLPSLFAIPMLFFAFQMMLGYKSPILPKIIADIKFKRSILEMIVRKSSPHIDKIERILHQRLVFMIYPLAEKMIGFLIFIYASFILIPVPFSNFLPGIGILVTSFGLIGKDGVFVILGLIIGIIGAIFSSLVILFGFEAISYIKDTLF